MQLKRLLQDDDSAVSPVIGVILMVAITVILAAVIATFVLGLGEQVSDTAPNANFQDDTPDSSYTLDASASGNSESGEVAQLTHASGPAIESDSLTLRRSDDTELQTAVDNALSGVGTYSDGDVTVSTSVTGLNSGEEVSAGDSIELEITLEVANSFDDGGATQDVTILQDEDVTLVWTNDGSSATLKQYTFEDITLTVENV